MSNFGDHPAGFFGDSSFYNGVATQSLRFDKASSAYLSRTPSSATNRKTWTFSTWFKIANPAVNHAIWSAGTTTSAGSGSRIALYLSSGGQFVTDLGGIGDYDRSVALFRDPSAWYHIVWAFDTTESTGSNRSRIYINGTEITLTKTRTWSLNTDYQVNYTVLHTISALSNGLGFKNDAYYAETNFVDGTQLTPSSFGETKNGVWIPIEYTGSYGTNGFRLQFDQVGVGTASTSTIGADTSGNTHHFTSSGIVASDCNMPDSPENNMCTLNSVGRRYGQSYVGTFSEGNLKVASGGNATSVFGTMAINQIASQGGVYFEVRMDSLDTARTYFGVIGDNGVNNKNSAANGAAYSFPIKGILADDPRGYFTTDTDSSGSLDLTANTAFSNGDVAGIAILSDGKFFCHRNGTYLNNTDGNTGNPSTGANPIATIDLTLGDWVPYVGYNSTFSVNFGQDGTFSGQETSGGNQDGNGIGDFMFAVPTNCLAICSSNMAEPTISPNSATQADDYFNTVIYSGNNDATRTFDIGFVSDWSWFKARNGSGYGHQLFDSSRGVTKLLYSNATNAESTNAEGVTSFDSSGNLAIGTDAFLNEDGTTMVIWNWKANGGTTSSNTDGSITSTIQANTTAGFSIVTYTGTGANATVGHGLGVAPKMIIMKRRDSAQNWVVYQEEVGNDREILLNTTGAQTNSNSVYFNNTSPTSTVFSLGSDNYANASSGTYVAYCFAEVEGYSKFGSYIGNGNVDGTFIYLGFRPAFIMYKRTNTTGNWLIDDNKTSTFNYDSNYLLANSADAEGDTTTNTAGHMFDHLSNGFKMRNTNAERNGNGDTIIYMAFAEAPFKYANAR